jgi:hypothetical protein
MNMVQSGWSRLFSLKNLNFLMTVLGGLFLGILIYSLGWAKVLGNLRKIGPGWLSIVGQEIFPLLVNNRRMELCLYPQSEDHEILGPAQIAIGGG